MLKILPWLIILLLTALIFVLHLKELTPKSFISVLKYKYYGYAKPEINKIKFIFYLQNEDVSEVNFYGHRGGAPEWLATENSLLAFEFGSAMGLKYFEIDVKLTKDLIPIVFHDEHMYRLTGINEFVKNLTLSQIEEIKYRDGQSILTIDELVTRYQNILIDLSANNFQDAIYITEYILNINNTSLQDRVIIQFADPKIVELVSKKYPKLKISYNEWGDRIKKTKIYKNYANIFTLNPSLHINKNIIEEIGSDKVIIAVVQGDDAGEIIRLKGIGIKNIMIRNSLLINREFYRNKPN